MDRMATVAATASRRLRKWLKSLEPTRSAIIVSAVLALLFEIAYVLAFYIRGELLVRPADADMILSTLWWVVGIKLVVFYTRGYCHRRFQAARFEDLNQLLRASTLALLVVTAVNYFASRLGGWVNIPRSVLLLDWAGTLLLVGGAQAVLRSIYEEILPTLPAGSERKALVIDASPEGREIAAALGEMRSERFFVAGLLDDDPARYGVHVGRARVLGPVGVAPACAERLRISDVIVREGAIYGSRLRSLCDACAELDVRVRIAEAAHTSGNRVDGRPSTIGKLTIRDIELRDMLTRPQAKLDDTDARVFPMVHGRCMLVTGAGGSIGSEICRQLVRFRPAKIVLVERSEAALFTIDRELRERHATDEIEIVPVLCDIANRRRTEQLLKAHRPKVVLHAAAFKHLPLMESHPIEAIENNTLATAALAELASAAGVETFVALSTDKAVNPSSVMGASKLLAERFLQSFAMETATKFVVVRFGNVLASSGSAVPIFEAQLARRETITITHPDVRRYFMTIDEAAQLVLVAAATGEQGGTFVLEMGEPIRIVDMVHSLAYVMKIPPEEVDIRYCGLRPGEKLDEELFFVDELQSRTTSPLVVQVSRPARSLADVRHWITDLLVAIEKGPAEAGRALLEIAERDCPDGSRDEIRQQGVGPQMAQPAASSLWSALFVEPREAS
jgi:FlaA1/EpsC-like NDP-sugar epimerase